MPVHRFVVAVLLVVASPGPAFAVGDQNAGIVELQYLVDDTENLSFEQAHAAAEAGQFQAITGNSVNFGFTKKDHWFRVTLQGSHTGWAALELSNPRLGAVTVYSPDGNGGYSQTSVGVRRPFWSRDLPGLSPAIPVYLTEGQPRPHFVRVENYGSLRFDLRLWSLPAHNRHANHVLAINLALAGALLSLALYNLCIYAHLRQSGYLWIGLFLCICALRQSAGTGTANMFLWPDASLWARHSVIVTGILAIFIGACTANSLLGLYTLMPRVARLNLALGVLALVAGLCSVAGVTTLSLYVILACCILLPCLITVCALYAAKKGTEMGLWFLLSWGVVLAASLVFNLAGPGFLPANYPAGYILDFALLAAGLAWSYTLTSQVKVQERRQRQRLETQVQERTAALQAALAAVRTLQGLLPMCSCCKKIRNEQGDWQQVEKYLQEHTDAACSHGICPECASIHYPEYFPATDLDRDDAPADYR